jgi:hypothetical protein
VRTGAGASCFSGSLASCCVLPRRSSEDGVRFG